MKAAGTFFGVHLCAGLAIQILLLQRFNGGNISQSEAPATTPMLHPLGGRLRMGLGILHTNSSLHEVCFSESDGGHRVDALGHILVRDPGL